MEKAAHIIARSPRDEENETPWRRSLAAAWRDPLALLGALGLDPAAVGFEPTAAGDFAFRVTREYAARMRAGDPTDPLLLQVLPHRFERAIVDGFGRDPVGESGLEERGSLLQKYAGRALLLLTGACAIHCRYCFRRAYPYAGHVGPTALDAGLAAIAADATITEVILSGGDPLVLDDAALAVLCTRLTAIPHVRRLRIHSRLPVVLPSRLTDELLEMLGGLPHQPVLVLHANHARELDDDVRSALGRARAAGVTLLNQAVLLRGVNDDTDSLAALGERLFDCGVLPYYVHLLDRVAGAAHFEVDEARARELEAALRARLPGYLVPRFVREFAGATSKLPLDILP
ncbi:MAG: EF-P beta-lysylation protein EpmB [Gammaproteobacteria bacterium]